MKISIIIPIYNTESYLDKCIGSAIGQTWKDIEIILINDGSTDNSYAICEKYCYDNRVIYHYQDNEGLSAARNVGLSLATGDYICFLDSDDWLELDALERLQNETADIIIYNFYHGDKKHEELLIDGYYNKEELYPKLLSYVDDRGDIAYVCHSVWMRMFKKSLIDNNGIRFNTRYQNGEDLLFTMEATMKATTISVRCSEYLYHWRQTPKSLTNSYIVNYWELRKEIVEKIYELISSDVLYEQMPLRIFSWVVTAIENELRYKGSKNNIYKIINDSLCEVFKGKLDSSNMNEKNKWFYEQICNANAGHIWKQHRYKEYKKKYQKIKKSIKRLF